MRRREGRNCKAMRKYRDGYRTGTGAVMGG